MKQCKSVVCLTALLIAAACSPAFSQTTNAPDAAATTAGMPDFSKPGENHKILAQMVGNWTYSGKFWTNPDTNVPPTVFSGKTVTKSIMGGRYFISDHKGLMSMPGPDGKLADVEFNGMELSGYDNMKQKFVSNWIDNFGTGIVPFEGVYDATAKAITYTGDEEPVPGMKIKVREVVTHIDHDHYMMEYFQIQGGNEMKAMEVKYGRASE